MRNCGRPGRLTTASCSFSNCEYISAAVRGRECRTGPGPEPTPLLSATAKKFDGRFGDGIADELEGLTVFSDGEPGTGGGGICWEDARRDELARKCGDGGTELRSGMAADCFKNFE